MSILLDENIKFTYNVRQSNINNLLKKYNFLKHGIIGKSLCGKNIDFLDIGNSDEKILWVAAHHGIEWLTSVLVFKFLNYVCEKVNSNEKIHGVDLSKQFQKTGLTIIPCLNPDGVDISLQGSIAAGKYQRLVEKVSNGNTFYWNSNARGVDLNHNYNAGWNELRKLEIKNKILGPSSTRYGGTHPHSEPETKAITSFCLKNNFKYAYAFHSQGEEIYWDYGKSTPNESEKIANILALASGYKVSHPEGLAIGGGFKDWFIETFKKPAFTIEIGKGKNPLPISCFDDIYNKIEKMLLISLLV